MSNYTGDFTRDLTTSRRPTEAGETGGRFAAGYGRAVSPGLRFPERINHVATMPPIARPEKLRPGEML